MTESTATFETSLSIILDALEKREWASPLKSLEQKFRQLPEDETSFSADILNMLHALHQAIALDGDLPLSQMMAIRLAGLNCWTYRFFRIESGRHHYLDPLNNDAAEFGHGVSVQQSTSSYPSTDIIKRWARENLR